MMTSNIISISFETPEVQKVFDFTLAQQRFKENLSSQKEDDLNSNTYENDIKTETLQVQLNPGDSMIKPDSIDEFEQDSGINQKQILFICQDQYQQSMNSQKSPSKYNDNDYSLNIGSESLKKASIDEKAHRNSRESADTIIRQKTVKSLTQNSIDKTLNISPICDIHYSPHESLKSNLKSDKHSRNQTISNSSISSILSKQSHMQEPVNLQSQNYFQEYFREEETLPNRYQDQKGSIFNENLAGSEASSDEFFGEQIKFTNQKIRVRKGSVCSQFQSKKNEILPKVDADITFDSKSSPFKEICYLNCKALQAVKKSKFTLALDYIRLCFSIKSTQKIEFLQAQPTLLNNYGLILLLQGDLEKSKEILEKCLELKRQNSRINCESIARSLILLGSVEKERRKFISALRYLNETVEILNSKYGFERKNVFQLTLQEFSIPVLRNFMQNFPNNKSINEQPLSSIEKNARKLYIKTLNNIGLVYCYDGKSGKAVLFFLRVLCLICQRQNEIFDIEDIYNDALHLMKENFKLEVSLQYIKKYLKLQQYLKNKYTSEYITLIVWIGNLYFDLGHWDKCLYQQKKALKIIKTHRLQNKAQQHEALEQIGLIYQRKKWHDSALKYFIVSLGVQEKRYGKKNKKWIDTKHHIASSYIQMKKHQEAIECYEDCLEEIKKIKSKEFEYLSALSFLKMIEVYQIQGDHASKQKIDNCYQEIQALSSDLKEEGNIEEGHLLGYISHAHQLRGDNNMAKEFSLKALRIYEKLNESFVFMSRYGTLKQLGFIFYKLQEYSLALDHYLQALQIIRSRFGENALIVADTRNQIANLFFTEEKYQKAIDQYKKELQIRDNVEEKITFELAKARQCIAMAYQKLSNLQQALFYYKQSQEMFLKLFKLHKQEAKLNYNFIEQRISVLNLF